MGGAAARSTHAVPGPDTIAAVLLRKAKANPDHWAFTPNEQDPSTWRLPLRDTEGAYDAKKVAAALGALSPDAYPSIPAKAHRATRAKVAAAWRAMHGKDAQLPAILRKADLFAPAPLDGQGVPRGVMIALVPDEATATALALDGEDAEPAEELHLTLVYLGDAGNMTPRDIADLPAVVSAWVAAERIGPLPCSVTGWAVFEADDPADAPAVALIDAPRLQQLRDSLCCWLNEHGYLTWDSYGYTPHITLAYGPWLEEGRLPARTPGVRFQATEVCVCWAGQVHRVPLNGDVAERRAEGGYIVGDWDPEASWVAKDDGKRYTMAPLYVPAEKDSHGEFASADDLEAAVWDYMRAGEFMINYEHMGQTRAGECVGIICWPFGVEATLINGKGEQADVTLPAGTVYQAVIWEEWAWPLVLDGKINALSMEGFARKVPAPV